MSPTMLTEAGTTIKRGFPFASLFPGDRGASALRRDGRQNAGGWGVEAVEQRKAERKEERIECANECETKSGQ